MPQSSTPNYGWNLPGYDEEDDTWWQTVKTSFDEIDADLFAVSQAVTSGVSNAAPTGMVGLFLGNTAPAGWVASNGSTLGNAASGATGRANADTEALFTFLWVNYPNTSLAIQDSGGAASTRGASAAADYAANKRMPTFDLRSWFPRFADMGRGVDAGRVPGTEQAGQMPAHTHDAPLYNGPGGDGGSQFSNYGSNNLSNTGTTNSTGGTSNASENRPPNFSLMGIVKL